MTALTPGAVLWDMDGTIVDTEPLWLSAQQGLVARHGLPPLTLAQDEQLVGASMDIAVRFFQQLGVPLGADQIVAELSMDVARGIDRALDWRPGARQLLRELRRNAVPTALVTNSGRLIVDEVLAQLHDHAFDAIVTGDDVVRGKPDPEPFLLAAGHLRLAPQRCIVVEDSLNGLGGAVAAECVPIGVPHAIELPPSPNYLVRPTLEGVAWRDLVDWYDEFHRRRPRAAAAHPAGGPAAGPPRTESTQR